MLDPQILAQLGRRGDTMVAHISPQEAAILKMLGGSGGINPYTGMPEFWDDGGNDPGGEGGMGGSGAAGGPDSDASSQSSDAFGVGSQEAQDNPTNSIGMSDEDRANLSEILSDMEANAQANRSDFSYAVDKFAAPVAGLVLGPFGYGLASAAQGKGAQAGLGIGATIGSVAGPIGGMLGGLAGYGIGYSIDNFGIGAPSPEEMSSLDDQSTGRNGGGNDYSSLAQNMVAGPSGVSTAQTVAQPESFDRDAFAQFGRGMINQQGSGSGTKASAASRGMGADSGQLAGQLAIQNKQRQAKMNEFNQLMSNPNMGYNDLAASLMNILA